MHTKLGDGRAIGGRVAAVARPGVSFVGPWAGTARSGGTGLGRPTLHHQDTTSKGRDRRNPTHKRGHGARLMHAAAGVGAATDGAGGDYR